MSIMLMTGISILVADKTEKDKQISFDPNAKNIVYYIPQFSDFTQISHSEMMFLKKTLKEAKKENVKAVIFEIDTPGGRVDFALKYVSILRNSEVPTIAYVKPHAISAGMIVALAADKIAINPNGIIGDAMPMQMSFDGVKPIVDKPEKQEEKLEDSMTPNKSKKDDKENKEKESKKDNKDKKNKDIKDNENDEITEEEKLVKQKFLTVFFKELEVLAEKNNRPIRVVRAMADPYQKLTMEKDNYEHSKISPLTLSAKEAKKLNIVDYIAQNKEDLKTQLGLENCSFVIKERTPIEQIVAFLSTSAISAILIMVGLVGIYIEVRTPGFGVPGIMGLTALTLFFWGHIGVGDSNWGPAVMFFVGVVLLIIEVFVIPGFGLTGILGFLSIFISLFMAFGTTNIEGAIQTVGIAIISATILMIILTVYILPQSFIFRRLSLSKTEKSEDGFLSHKTINQDVIGQIAVVYSTLRPSGSIKLGDKRYDAVTVGDFIKKDEEVKVIDINGAQIVVEKLM